MKKDWNNFIKQLPEDEREMLLKQSTRLTISSIILGLLIGLLINI